MAKYSVGPEVSGATSVGSFQITVVNIAFKITEAKSCATSKKKGFFFTNLRDF